MWAKLTHNMKKFSIKKFVRKFFEKKSIRKIFGLNLAIVILLTSFVSTPISSLKASSDQELVALTENVVELTTQRSVRVPLDTFEVTQGYSLFHRGIDLNEDLGAPIYPIMDGRVEAVFYSRFSYGNHVLINHGSGFKSLYAHLSKIIVLPGDEVDKNTVIGTVGSTGWSTGSHLHLEVYENNRTFNPLTILK